VATDPKDPGHAKQALSEFATETHVAKGGAVVATSCSTCAPGAGMDRANLSEKDISYAGFSGQIGFRPDGTLEVPLGSKTPVSPGEARPGLSSGPEQGKNLRDFILGAEKRVNPPAPPKR